MQLSVTENIRQTWALAASNPTTPHVFYANLFRVDPTTKPLFVGDLKMQGRKLAETLTFIVDNLENPDNLIPAAKDLARRHTDYGVGKEQYGSVGNALMMTLKQLLGPALTPEAADAWEQTYAQLCEVMIDAAYES